MLFKFEIQDKLNKSLKTMFRFEDSMQGKQMADYQKRYLDRVENIVIYWQGQLELYYNRVK